MQLQLNLPSSFPLSLCIEHLPYRLALLCMPAMQVRTATQAYYLMHQLGHPIIIEHNKNYLSPPLLHLMAWVEEYFVMEELKYHNFLPLTSTSFICFCVHAWRQWVKFKDLN